MGILVGVALTHWTTLSRIIRAEILSIKGEPYIVIAKKLGTSNVKIASKHILPHIIPQFIVGVVLLFPHAILHEAGITFLGFGLPPEEPAIGVILSESMRYITSGYWWLAFFPGLALMLMVFAFDAIGHNLEKLLILIQDRSNVMNILEVKNLNIGFNMYDKLLNQKLHQMVFDLNVTIKKGEILAIAGSSGSGKSLMAHAILGILPKNAVVSAEIKFKNEIVDENRLSQLRGKEITFVPQSIAYLDPLMTIEDQLMRKGINQQDFLKLWIH